MLRRSRIRPVRSKPRPGRLRGDALKMLRVDCYARDRGRCQSCVRMTIFDAPHIWGNSYHMDHIVPRHMGADFVRDRRGVVESMTEKSANMDTRIAYGANCLWWGSIHEAGNTARHPAHQAHNEAQKRATPRFAPLLERGLPCCPLCGGMLFEVGTEEQWMAGVDNYEAAGHPGYRDFILWQRGKCFPNMAAAVSAYRAQGGMYAPVPEGQA